MHMYTIHTEKGWRVVATSMSLNVSVAASTCSSICLVHCDAVTQVYGATLGQNGGSAAVASRVSYKQLRLRLQMSIVG